MRSAVPALLKFAYTPSSRTRVSDNLLRNLRHKIGGDGKPHPVGRRIELRIDRAKRRDTDQVALQIDQRGGNGSVPGTRRKAVPLARASGPAEYTAGQQELPVRLTSLADMVQ
jgi:hypothetical protein